MGHCYSPIPAHPFLLNSIHPAEALSEFCRQSCCLTPFASAPLTTPSASHPPTPPFPTRSSPSLNPRSSPAPLSPSPPGPNSTPLPLASPLSPTPLPCRYEQPGGVSAFMSEVRRERIRSLVGHLVEPHLLPASTPHTPQGLMMGV